MEVGNFYMFIFRCEVRYIELGFIEFFWRVNSLIKVKVFV